MEEGWPFKAVSDGAGGFHTICHPWWTAGEHANLWKQDILLLEAVEELVEVRTAKVGYGAQSCEETAPGQLLEVLLADVLHEKDKFLKVNTCTLRIILTSMVVRRSNLSKNWVMKM